MYLEKYTVLLQKNRKKIKLILGAFV